MKHAAEIRKILTQDLGLRDLAAYKKWIVEVRPTIKPTPERIELLSPDNVDCTDFWKVCDELFGHDPVCNLVVEPQVGRLPFAIETDMDANRMNLRLAKSFGITAFLEENAHDRLKTLEVGPGFGSLKNFIETHTRHVYTGVDVVPRIPGVVQTTARGTLPESVLRQAGTFAYVVATNVFQHLSARQRSTYYKDAHALLLDGGLFIFNTLVNTGKLPPHTIDAQGDGWCDHYGQYTLVPRPADLYGEVASLFDILYVTQRYDGVFNFVCQKREPSSG